MHVESTITIPSAAEYHAVPRRTFRECAALTGLPEKQINRLELALGEALANVARHCYDNAPDQPIIVQCIATQERLELRITDHGPCVDVSKLPTSPTPSDEPGGLGLHLIRKVMTSVEFSKCPEGGNVLTLIYQLPPQEAT